MHAYDPLENLKNKSLRENERIVDGLTFETSKLRVIYLFATVVFGIRLDLKDIRQIIHIGVPCSIEEYFQEERWPSIKGTHVL